MCCLNHTYTPILQVCLFLTLIISNCPEDDYQYFIFNAGIVCSAVDKVLDA